MSPVEILDVAARVVDLSESNNELRFDLRTGGVPFDECSLCSVFADGGWKILSRANSYDLGLDDSYDDELLKQKRITQSLMEIAA